MTPHAETDIYMLHCNENITKYWLMEIKSLEVSKSILSSIKIITGIT